MHSAIMICKLWDTLFCHDSQTNYPRGWDVCDAKSITGYLPYTGVHSYQYNMKEERKFAMSWTKTRRENVPNLSDKIEKMLKNTCSSTCG